MRFVKFLIIFVVCFCIILFLYQTDFRSVYSTLQAVGCQILWVFPMTALAYYLGTLSWQSYLPKDQKSIGIGRLFLIRQIGETIGLFNPTSVVGGDFTKIHYLRRLQIPEHTATNSVISSRITMVLSQILLASLTLIWLLYHTTYLHSLEDFRWALYLLLCLLVVVQIMLFYWMYRGKKTTASFENEGAYTHTGSLKEKMLRILHDLRTSFRRDKKTFFRSYIFALLHWLVGSLEFYLILSILGIDIAVMESLLMDMGVILVKSAGAFIPGQIGIEELGNKVVLAVVGLQRVTLWVSVSLLRRFRQLFWAFIGGLAYLYFIKQTPASYALSK